MKRSSTAVFCLIALAGSAAFADNGNGPRHRDLVREAREAREAQETRERPPQAERRPADAERPPRPVDRRPSDAERPPARAERRPPGFADRDDPRRDPRLRDDERRERDWRSGDRRGDDRWRSESRRYERRDHDRYAWRDPRGRPWRYEPRWYDDYRLRHYRYYGGRHYARERFYVGIYLLPRGYSYRVWRIGEWLPWAYYDGGRYELRDYWRYGLYDPPYWARWIRVRDDALLVDLDTGEVIDVVYDLFW
jgi:hypothetical protein